ncbi:MAG: M20/M25/M40 family metallo-hydrolase [Gemmatimonadaceae bacterium]|nr:M20/M25/M40 family metallo-hydrolase [Gemmatimonadaceae bacterium]
MQSTSCLLALTGILCAVPVGTSVAQTPSDLQRLQDESVQRAREYLRINTANPPGNEAEAMRWFARILAQEGIPFDTASPAPGRGNIWARLKGGNEPALLLLHHMDVVPADPRYWDVDPFSGELRNGDLYGRGALDTKLLGIAHLQAFIALHRFKVPLDRDVIFMATADEEAGGAFGAGWIVKNRPDAFRGTGFVLNEGGSGSLDAGRQQVGIEVTQKVPLWLKLVATGNPGHGSQPQVATAVTRLVRALERLRTYEFAPRIVPAVDAYFKGIAPNAGPWQMAFQDMAAAVRNPATLLRLQAESPAAAALTRNTCSITMLEGSNKINVVPTEATAQIDCRTLPDQDHDAFIAELAAAINDPGIRIEKILGFAPAVSPQDNLAYRAMVDVTRRHFPQASVIPLVQTGFTDSHFFRALGIPSYGYAPFLIPVEQAAGLHGNNERMSEANLRRGTAIMLDVVRRIAQRTATP